MTHGISQQGTPFVVFKRSNPDFSTRFFEVRGGHVTVDGVKYLVLCQPQIKRIDRTIVEMIVWYC